MLCRDFADPPDIAVCVGGTARTLVNELVHQSLRDNVLNAFGAPTTLFAYLRAKDHRSGSRHSDADANALPRILTRLGAKTEHVNVLIGKQELSPPACPSYDAFPATGEQRAYLGSLLAQLDARRGCHNLIAAEERARGRNYSWVLFTRPDMLWYRPVPPWCTIRVAAAAGVIRQDWAFLVSRELADAAMSQLHDDYHGCRAPFGLEDGIEGWVATRGFPGRAERWEPLGRLLGKKLPDAESAIVLPAFLIRQPEAENSTMCACIKMNGIVGATDVTDVAKPGVSANWCRPLVDHNSCNRPS